MLVAYTMLGTSDVDRATSLYGPLMALLGAQKVEAYSTPTRVWYGRDGRGLLAIGLPHDGAPATHGNGTMVAIPVGSKAEVDAAHAKALELGATDEGAPGVRGPTWYGAYFRDFDGNKLAVFHLLQD